VVDFFLPLRKRFDVEAFAKVNDDGSLEETCMTDRVLAEYVRMMGDGGG
jgi:hypothetical protein